MGRKAYYKKRQDHFIKMKAGYVKKYKLLSLLRLVLFVLIIFSFIYHEPLGRLFFPVLFILVLFFIGLIVRYINLKKKIERIKAYIHVNKTELRVLDWDFQHLDTGGEFFNPDHVYSYDLDVFGEGSVFQYINRTNTSEGHKQLAKWLQEPSYKQDEIIERQEAVKELSAGPDNLQDFLSLFINDDGKEIQSLKTWLQKSDQLSTVLNLLSFIFPLAGFLIFIGVIIFHLPLSFFIFWVIFQLFIVGVYSKKVNYSHQQLSNSYKLLKRYSRIIEFLSQQKYRCSYLKRIQKLLYSEDFSAGKALKKLSFILDAFDNRLNLFAGFLLNALFMYDFHCIRSLEKWRQRFKSYAPDWFQAIAEYDAMVSLSVYAFNQDTYVYPQLESNVVFRSRLLGHPLIPGEERVCNDFSFEKKDEFAIVTGANMAGKSTFLRAFGVNLVLAGLGVPVCADEFIYNPAPIYSSMRTTDSLYKHESYFYAELKRLKGLISSLDEGERMFVLLDELLKGTNSKDQSTGAIKLLERLIGKSSNGIVATHDLQLTQLEKKYPENFMNYCFEVKLEAENILFDYQLRKGITTRMNALELMKKMDIIF